MARRDLQFGGTVPLDAGLRDRAVTIQRRTSSTGATHFPVETWATLVTPAWMRKLDLRVDERTLGEQLSAKGQTLWEMAYRADMDPELVDVPAERRLVYQGRTYDIVGASLIGRREAIELTTIAKVG